VKQPDQWIVADRGGRGFALPLPVVVRVTPSPRICEAPLLPPGYVGVIEFEGHAVPVWDPYPETGDFMWGATVIIAQVGDSSSQLLGLLTDAPPKIAIGGEVVSPEEIAEATKAASAPAAPAPVEEEVDWSVGPAKAKAVPIALPTLPAGPMWDKVVRFAGHPVPVLDPACFSLLPNS
jgi:hypothetical protein